MAAHLAATAGTGHSRWQAAGATVASEEGWLFLAVVIGRFSRKVVGWSMRPDMQCNLVIDALEMAWFKRNPGKKTEHLS